MSQRNTGIIRRCHNRRDPRHHLERHVGIGQFFGFLTAAAENIRVAAFESNDRFAFARAGDEQCVELLLRNGAILGPFAAKNHLSGVGRQPQQFEVDQPIIDHHIRAPQ